MCTGVIWYTARSSCDHKSNCFLSQTLRTDTLSGHFGGIIFGDHYRLGSPRNWNILRLYAHRINRPFHLNQVPHLGSWKRTIHWKNGTGRYAVGANHVSREAEKLHGWKKVVVVEKTNNSEANAAVLSWLWKHGSTHNISPIKKKEKWTPEARKTGGGSRQTHSTSGSQEIWGPEVQPEWPGWWIWGIWCPGSEATSQPRWWKFPGLYFRGHMFPLTEPCTDNQQADIVNQLKGAICKN